MSLIVHQSVGQPLASPSAAIRSLLRCTVWCGEARAPAVLTHCASIDAESHAIVRTSLKQRDGAARLAASVAVSTLVECVTPRADVIPAIANAMLIAERINGASNKPN